MKKFTLLVATAMSLIGFAQHDHNQHSNDTPFSGQCGNNAEMEKRFAEQPELKLQYELEQAEFDAFYQDFLENYDPNARSAYVIPVVFHVVHEYGPENVSDAQIYDGLEKINEDFSMTNNDLSDVIPAFSGIVGDADIEFRLATKDPQGNCHPGITRTYMPGGGIHDVGDNDGVRLAIQAEHGTWPQNKYMNIIIVKSFTSDGSGQTLGYTNTPAGWITPSSMEGSIYMAHFAVGTIESGSSSYRHVMSHEVGHWLNLRHVWGQGNTPGEASNCSGGDGVSDTPKTEGSVFICDYNQATCDGSLDNVQNIMDYSPCRRMFTQGQATRMVAALNSGTAQRNNLWTAGNLQATGVDVPAPLCEVSFSSNLKVICAGQSIDFSDDSFHNVTSRSWSFQGGTPATSTVENPVVTYNAPGVYDVSLLASDGSNSATNTATDYIIVLSDPGLTPPYHDGFEATTSIPDNNLWMVNNENDAAGWELTNLGGAGGTFHSAKLGNFGNTDGTIDELISGSIDLSWVDPADPIVFTFEYAYRKRSASNDEWLRFYISKDCGETWVLRKNWHGDGLSPLVQTSEYIGGGPQEWYFTDVTSINSTYYASDFRFKFQFENDGGNNIYIDNINLYPLSMTELSEVAFENAISLYPNPATEMTTIQLGAKSGQDYNISIVSSLGQIIDVVYQGELKDGLNKINYNTAELATGIYLVRIESEGRLQTVKLIKD